MASEADIAATIKDIIAERLDKSAEEVVPNAGFMEDLGADSLDLTELLMALEEEFNIDIDDDANQIETVGDAIKYVQSKL
ncbi:MAG: acyl carrier protein [Candidatus Hydrogenedentes bacterium]|nr:acyl carrier protein [Candidatus Hydrogenedentota bacterium]